MEKLNKDEIVRFEVNKSDTCAIRRFKKEINIYFKNGKYIAMEEFKDTAQFIESNELYTFINYGISRDTFTG